jgi:hypothetical protein
MKTCVNHPDKEALSTCHNCGSDYCELCLTEGKEYYYCHKYECQEMLKKELSPAVHAGKVICPSCESELELSEEERQNGKIHCPECEAFINFTVNPPKYFAKENFVALLSSLNLGDIAVIKSILDDGGIEYYVMGENFLSIDPLIVPAKFFIKEDEVETAKILLKDFEFHFFGASNNQYEET